MKIKSPGELNIDDDDDIEQIKVEAKNIGMVKSSFEFIMKNYNIT